MGNKQQLGGQQSKLKGITVKREENSINLN